MIVYCLAKQPESLLLDVQKRIWREHHPQADFVVIVTRTRSSVMEHANQALSWIKDAGHRFAFIIHEDCIPLRRLEPAEVLAEHTWAGRTGPDGLNPHPSRTWLVADCHQEGKKWKGYGSRAATLDDLPAPADASIRHHFEYLDPGFLHLNNWAKCREDDPRRLAKRDWLQSAYSDYAQLPSLPCRVLSFAKAVVATATRGEVVPIVPRDVWQQRLEICSSCDAYEASRGRCHYCGCSMKTKARLKSQDCPIGKWPPLQEYESDADQPAK